MTDQHPPPDQHHSGSEDSEDEEASEDEWDKIPKIDLDPSKLTPLSPEVISKQVRLIWLNQVLYTLII